MILQIRTLRTFFAVKDGETLYNQQKQDQELTIGSDHELTAKIQAKLKKVGKNTKAFSSVQSSPVTQVVSDSVTPWTAAHQASLSITNSQSIQVRPKSNPL